MLRIKIDFHTKFVTRRCKHFFFMSEGSPVKVFVLFTIEDKKTKCCQTIVTKMHDVQNQKCTSLLTLLAHNTRL